MRATEAERCAGSDPEPAAGGAGASDKDGPPRVRARHYNNYPGIKGIQQDGVIMAEDQNKVFFEKASSRVKSRADAENKFRIKPGKGRNYVETRGNRFKQRG